MKKKVGELQGKPIVIGDENEVTRNEYHYSNVDGIVVIKMRLDDGKMHSVTTREEPEMLMATSIEEESEIINNVEEENKEEVSTNILKD